MTCPAEQSTTPQELDVFRFSCNHEKRTKRFELNHCFDGQLVCYGGILVDTYWGFDVRECGRRFTPQEAANLGALIFLCNLKDVEPISEWEFDQYDEADRFDLSYQHRCHKKLVIRKGALKSVANQLSILEERVKKAKRDAEDVMASAFRCIELCADLRKRLEAGEDVTV